MRYLVIILFTASLMAKVEPPNYDFSLDSLKVFYPFSELSNIKKKYPQITLSQTNGQFKTYKVFVKHIRYRFPVLIQVKGNIVTDFYARLPAYFLHDIFHQSLINRFGKQDKYFKKEEAAVYTWNNKKGLKHIYSGTCTITCFPIYYTVAPVKHKFGGRYAALFESMN